MGFFSALIGGALNVVSIIGKTLGPELASLLAPVLEKLCKAFAAFFKELGIIEPDEKTVELGDKALQAEMDEEHPIRPEDFDKYSDYIDAIKKYTPDPDLSSQISEEEKERKGMELESGLALEKYGEPMLDVLMYVCAHPERFEDGAWLKALGKEINMDNAILPIVANYIARKNQSVADDDKAFETLERVEKSITPDAPDSVIFENINKRVSGDN